MGQGAALKKSYQIINILIATYVLLSLVTFPRWTVDDAQISFRYAENLVLHGQLTFNVGEGPIEGYTGVLWTLMLAGAIRLGVQPGLATQLLGITSFVLVLIFFDRLLGRLRVAAPPRTAAVVLLATAPFLYTHVYSGLETIFFTAILLGSALLSFDLIASESVAFGRHAALAGTLLALALTRPEGAAYALLAGGLIALLGRARFKSFTPALAFLLVFALPGGLYFAWRWRYYGYPLPNTFYAKVGGGFSPMTLSTLLLLQRQHLTLPLVGVAATWALAFKEAMASLRQGRAKYLSIASLAVLGQLSLFAIVVLAQYLRATLIMNFAYRFYAPFYPVALLLLAWTLSPAFEALRASPRMARAANAVGVSALGALLLAQAAYNVRRLHRDEMPFAFRYETRQVQMHRAAGYYLRERVPASEWLVVHVDAGAIPLCSRLKTIDFGALNDTFLAHNKTASLARRVDYFFSRNPGALVFTSFNWTRVDHGPEADAIVADPRFNGYALVRKYRNSLGLHYFEFVFLRRDLLRDGEEIAISEK